MTTNCDVVVLGLGPGGEEVAGKLAEAGLDVVAIDGRLVGGECPYFACVPTKMMVRAANAIVEVQRANAIAGTATITPQWSLVAQRIRTEATDNWNDQVAVDRLTGKGARFVRGYGKVVADRTVEVDGERFVASKGVVLATGTSPAIPPIEGLISTPYWTNRDMVKIEEIPTSIIVLGGGAVGCEMAQVMRRFGADVTIVQRSEHLLPRDEPEAGQLIADVFRGEGIHVHTGASLAKVAFASGSFTASFDDGSMIEAERLLVATGRRIDLDALGLSSVNVDTTQHHLPVDSSMRAGDGLWAVGDINGKGQFTHVSMYQARIAVADILGRHPDVASYRALPRVTFTDPEVATVGLTEHAARRQLTVRTGRSNVAESSRGWIHKIGNEGFIKVVEDVNRGVLVGATSVGPVGGEVLGFLALAVHAEIPVEQLRTMIYAYPTFYRGIEDALRNLRA